MKRSRAKKQYECLNTMSDKDLVKLEQETYKYLEKKLGKDAYKVILLSEAQRELALREDA
jgi:hypothetical protein